MRSSSKLQHLVCLVAAGVVLLPAYAGAQCAFDRPTGSTTYTGYLSTSIVRAFVSCNNPGGDTPNVTNTTGTVPACAPVENFNEQAGSPSNGWEFRPGSSYGRVTIKRTSGGQNINGLPTTATDAAVTIKLYHIHQTSGGFASGDGTLQLLLRATMDDYTEGDMTVIDFPFGLPIHLSGNGSFSSTTKIGDYLRDQLHLPRFPDCTSLEIVSIAVHDANGNAFATMGVKFP